MRVLVTGSTGGLGREILSVPRSGGIVLRALTRREPGGAADVEWARADLATGEGLSQAVAGVNAIIHAATDSRNADSVDVRGTRLLVAAAALAGVRHLVYVSIVGVGQIPIAYYSRKLAVEELVTAGGLPYSILRATQFHSLVNAFVARASRVPFIMPLPTKFIFQNVAAADVARRLWQCLAEGPRGRLPDMVGPEMMTLGGAAAVWREVRGVRKPIVHLPIPGAVAAAFRAGKNTNPDGMPGTTTWRDWLIERAATREPLPAVPDGE
jgi:uncharacterized protein YbjT (DUF2867 family)